MAVPDIRYITLFKAHLNGTLDAKGVKELAELTEAHTQDEIAQLMVTEMEQLPELAYTGADWDGMLHEILTQKDKQDKQEPRSIPPVHRIHFIKRLRWIAAAVILFAIAGTYYVLNNQNAKPNDNSIANHQDVAPGHQGAVITLLDGKRIQVDTLRDGLIAEQNGIQIAKVNGEIVYQGQASTTAYNTMSTDKGRQIQLVLPDGTKVWLNSMSSIHYPLQFSKKERVVETTGEAYFEVVHSDITPFIVKTGDQQIRVLGTHFNVKAYTDEPGITTTLLQGSVAVSKGNNKSIIKPGQQATTHSTATTIQIAEANTDEAIAWINGKFKFSNTDLQTAMRQIARWYDVQVIYEEGVGDSHFFGGTSMAGNLSEVLKVLELSGLHFRIEGNKLIVTK